jgi:uncharacterized protein (TIRG00374 family)
MNPKLKRILSFLFIVLSITAVFFIAFSNQDLTNAWDAIKQMNVFWLGAIFLCWLAYTFFDGMNYWCYLNHQGFKISIGRAVNVALIGFYYSNITPGATGGQPMQVNSMRKAGIPVGYGTMAVTIRFITNQTVVSVLALVLFLLNRSFVYQQLEGAIWFVRIGWLINFAAVPLVLLAAFKRNWIQRLAELLIGWLEKIHLVRNKDITISKVTEVLDTYHTALLDLMHSPGQILLQFACSTLGLLSLFATTVFVYYAFGLTGTPWYQILTISSLLFVSASYTPLPGASGAQEGGFLYFFRGIFTGGTIGIALLIWRFFTYYLFLFVGLFTTLLEKIRRRRR